MCTYVTRGRGLGWVSERNLHSASGACERAWPGTKMRVIVRRWERLRENARRTAGAAPRSERRTDMGTKTGILIGVGIGYVLGARAGRERYEQIRAGASKVRRFPVVARPLDAAGQKVSDFVRAGGEQVTDKVADAVKERLFGAPASPATVDAQPAPASSQR